MQRFHKRSYFVISLMDVWFHLVFLAVVCCAGTSVLEDVKRLRETLTSHEKDKMPPFPDDEQLIFININFTLGSDVDLTSDQIFTAIGTLTITWTDSNKTWNPDDYSGVSYIEASQDEIWTPRVILANSAESLDPLESKYPVNIAYNGQHQWTHRAIFRTRCTINPKLYPFDTQACSLIFSPISRNVRIKPTVDTYNLPESENRSEWTVRKIESALGEYDGVEVKQYYIILSRQFMYYIFNIIGPMALLSLLTPIVFLIPARSGEKLSYLMSVFLSYNMFLNIIQDAIPASSGMLSNLSMFLLIVQIQGFMTIYAVVMVIAVHHRKEKAEEKKVRKLSIMGNQDTEQKRKSKCACFNCERFLDGVFFVLALMASGAGMVVLYPQQRASYY